MFTVWRQAFEECTTMAKNPVIETLERELTGLRRRADDEDANPLELIDRLCQFLERVLITLDSGILNA
jgi:hypothetical protein